LLLNLLRSSLLNFIEPVTGFIIKLVILLVNGRYIVLLLTFNLIQIGIEAYRLLYDKRFRLQLVDIEKLILRLSVIYMKKRKTR